MVIRFAKKEDLKPIVELCKLHANYEKAVYTKENKIELLTKYFFDYNKLGLKCLIVESNGDIVGYATFFKQFSTWDAAHYIYLDCLFIKENVRGKGIGMQIMKLIKEYAKSVDCSIIQWQTPIFNKKAIKFYNKLGAEPKSKERFTWRINQVNNDL